MRHLERADDSSSDQKNHPVFPKMHVNDTDRVCGSVGGGGPKPSPRNKMAIYDHNQPPAAAATVNAGSTSQRIFTYTTTTPPPTPLLPPPKYSGISPSGSSICYVKGGHIPPASAAAVRFPFYAHNAAAMINTSTLPTLPLLPPFSKLHDGQPVSTISQEKRPPQVSSGRKIEKKHPPALEIFSHRHFRNDTNGGRECVTDVGSAELYTQRCPNPEDALKPSTSTTNWQLKQSDHNSIAFASSSPAKHANNSTEELCASDLNRRDSRLSIATRVDDIRGVIGGYATSNDKPQKHCEYIRDPESQNVYDIKGSHLGITPAESNCAVITPEDVSAIIAKEAFLRMRSEMIKHQKQFLEQVFELHRLITVQRLIARSRWTVFGDKYKSDRPSSSRRTMNPKEAQKGHSVERKDDTFRLKSSSGCISDMFCLPQQRKNTFKVPPITPRTIQETITGNTKPANASGMNSHWNYPSAGTANHWLVPIMSPSEGLIYKPYSIPPTTSPVGYTPPPVQNQINLPKPIQTHPPPCQQSGIRPLPDIPFCIPPYVTSSAFEHIGKSESYYHPNAALPGRSFKNSWNFSTLGSGTVSCQLDAANLAKYGGDSTASSSPPDRTQGNILPLFPEEPTAMGMLNKVQHRHQQNQCSEQQQRKVIKVVPRPPMLESRLSVHRHPYRTPYSPPE